MERKNGHNPCSMNFSNTCQHSIAGSLSKISTPTVAYKRRRCQRDFDALLPYEASEKAHPNTYSLSVISCEAPSLVSNKHIVSVEKADTEAVEKAEIEAVRSPLVIPVKSTALLSKSVSSGCSLGEEFCYVKDSKCDMDRNLDACLVNDSCSSSKSNMDMCATLKTVVDNTGECSSSEAFFKGSSSNDLFEKDVHILILRSLGIYKGVSPVRTSASPEVPGPSIVCSCLRSCKVCDRLELTVKMLICDQCEEAFHISCCYSRLRKLPINEWFCHSCIKKKHKISKELTARGRIGISKDYLGPIVSMLEDTEPYATSVHIGLEYQAEVPDWSGPLANEVDNLDELLEVSLSDSFQERYSTKPSKVSSICNWLQCKAIIHGVGEGVDGTLCEKWRRYST